MSDGTQDNLTRRTFIRRSAAATAAAAVPLETACGLFDRQEVLTRAELETYAAIADTLVPGAADAQVSTFLKAMLSSENPMLTFKFMSMPLPAKDFYRSALAAIDALSQRMHGKRFVVLNTHERMNVVSASLEPEVPAWSGPPPLLIYFIVRNDAVDAVYGWPKAYDGLDIPYFAHIDPPNIPSS